MKIGITRTLDFRRSPEEVFDFTNAAENLTSFSGYGPIPGIREARYRGGMPPQLGAIREVIKTDGTVHVEEITRFERPVRHISRITGLSPPFSWLVRSGEDDWMFHREGGITRVTRTFSFELTSPLIYPVAVVVLHLFVNRAVEIDLRNTRARLEEGKQ